MLRPSLVTLCCATSLALLACNPLPGASPTPSSSPVATQTQGGPAKPSGIVTGVAKAPRNLIGRVLPTGGSNIVGNNGAKVLPTGGANVLPTGGANLAGSTGDGLRRLLAVDEQPLGKAQVFLADAAGQPYPSLAPVETDAEGRFSFPAVPAGYTFMVVVAARDTKRDKDVTLQTLVKSSELGASTAIDSASSLVTLAVTEGQGGALGDLNVASFRTATEAAARHLTDAGLPDFSDRTAILSKVAELEKSITELKLALAAIRQDLKDIKASLEEIKTAVANQPQRPGPMGPGFTNGTGARAGDCGGGGTFSFTLKKSYDRYPLRVDFVSPYGHHKGQLVFNAPGVEPSMFLPYGCPHAVTLRDADGKILATEPSFAVPIDSSPRVELPF